jgi:hypothetical protein
VICNALLYQVLVPCVDAACSRASLAKYSPKSPALRLSNFVFQYESRCAQAGEDVVNGMSKIAWMCELCTYCQNRQYLSNLRTLSTV